jgi:hypothetical protein
MADIIWFDGVVIIEPYTSRRSWSYSRPRRLKVVEKMWHSGQGGDIFLDEERLILCVHMDPPSSFFLPRHQDNEEVSLYFNSHPTWTFLHHEQNGLDFKGCANATTFFGNRENVWACHHLVSWRLILMTLCEWFLFTSQSYLLPLEIKSSTFTIHVSSFSKGCQQSAWYTSFVSASNKIPYCDMIWSQKI